MKGRKTAAIPGIIMAAVAIADNEEFGLAVKDYLERCGEIRGKNTNLIRLIKNANETANDDFEFGDIVRKLLIKKGLIVERDGKYEASKS